LPKLTIAVSRRRAEADIFDFDRLGARGPCVAVSHLLAHFARLSSFVHLKDELTPPEHVPSRQGQARSSALAVGENAAGDVVHDQGKARLPIARLVHSPAEGHTCMGQVDQTGYIPGRAIPRRRDIDAGRQARILIDGDPFPRSRGRGRDVQCPSASCRVADTKRMSSTEGCLPAPRKGPRRAREGAV
jgi:hypothetical protein